MTRSSTASVTSMTSVKVSTNGGTPIAGWFIMEHPIKKNWWFGATHFRKPPNINRYSTDINSIYASPMESHNPGAAWFVADLEITKKIHALSWSWQPAMCQTTDFAASTTQVWPQISWSITHDGSMVLPLSHHRVENSLQNWGDSVPTKGEPDRGFCWLIAIQ